MGQAGCCGLRGAEVIDVIDAVEIVHPENADETLAYFILWASDGDRIAMHGLMCRTQSDDRAACTCAPRSITLGPRA